MPEPKRSDEIDLFALLLKTIYFIRGHFLLMVLLVVIGISLGVAHFFVTEKVYENKMIVSSNILTNTYSKILFDNLNRHLREGNLEIVAKDLGIKEEVIKSVRRVQIEGLQKDATKDLAELDRFVIMVEVNDQNVLPELQKAIPYYLENNEFVKTRVELGRQTSKRMLTALEKEISDMETLKKRISNGEFFQFAKGNVSFDPTTVNSKILELTEKRLALQNALELSNSVYIIEGFTRFKQQTRPKLLFSIVGGALSGLFFALIVIVIKSISALVKRSEAEFGRP